MNTPATPLPLSAILYEGGSTYQHYRWVAAAHTRTTENAWELLKGYYPALIPNLDILGAQVRQKLIHSGLLWSDVPLPRSGLRLMTAVYRVNAGREFWNVFSFAYPPEPDCLEAIRSLMTYGPQDWQQLAENHHAGSRELQLLPRSGGTDAQRRLAAAWDGLSPCVLNFPLPDGSLRNGLLPADWQQTLFPKDAPLPPCAPAPSAAATPSPRRVVQPARRSWQLKPHHLFFLGLLSGGALTYAIMKSMQPQPASPSSQPPAATAPVHHSAAAVQPQPSLPSDTEQAPATASGLPALEPEGSTLHPSQQQPG